MEVEEQKGTEVGGVEMLHRVAVRRKGKKARGGGEEGGVGGETKKEGSQERRGEGCAAGGACSLLFVACNGGL